jgi:hypothetical protein
MTSTARLRFPFSNRILVTIEALFPLKISSDNFYKKKKKSRLTIRAQLKQKKRPLSDLIG